MLLLVPPTHHSPASNVFNLSSHAQAFLPSFFFLRVYSLRLLRKHLEQAN